MSADKFGKKELVVSSLGSEENESKIDVDGERDGTSVGCTS